VGINEMDAKTLARNEQLLQSNLQMQKELEFLKKKNAELRVQNAEKDEKLFQSELRENNLKTDLARAKRGCKDWDELDSRIHFHLLPKIGELEEENKELKRQVASSELQLGLEKKLKMFSEKKRKEAEKYLEEYKNRASNWEACARATNAENKRLKNQ